MPPAEAVPPERVAESLIVALPSEPRSTGELAWVIGLGVIGLTTERSWLPDGDSSTSPQAVSEKPLLSPPSPEYSTDQ